MADDRITRSLEAWKVSVEVQQHFNDLEMKIRNYALTLLLAVAAGVGVSLREDQPSVALWLLWGGLVVWTMFYLMDEWWYHRLLIGAVKNAMDLEEQLIDDVPGIGLSTRIKEESAVRVGKLEVRSNWKIRIFYGVIAFLLLGVISRVEEYQAPVRSSGSQEVLDSRLTPLTHS